MTKRDYIEEIEAKNARATPYSMHGLSEIYSIQNSLEAQKKPSSTFLALHIMGAASCIEVGVRDAIKRLVNHGSPYLERASNFNRLEFDFALTAALSAGRITFGDLVSHLLPVIRVGHIAAHIETLFNGGKSRNKFSWMLSQVRVFCEPDEDLLLRGESAEIRSDSPHLLQDPDRTLRVVAEIFTRRHLVAHEAKFDVVSKEKAKDYIETAEQFLQALYEMVEQTLNPGASRSGFGSSIQNQSRAGQIISAIEQLESEYMRRLNGRIIQEVDIAEKFKNSVAAFKAYLAAEDDFRFALASPVTGNAMRNISADVIDGLCKPRLSYLNSTEEWLELYLD